MYNKIMRPRQNLINHLMSSFSDAFRGLSNTWAEERNFRIEVFIAILVIGILLFFNFSYVDISLAVMAIVLVLASEVVNTAFEDTLDRIEPGFDPVIGKIKDVSAGIVVLNVFGAFVIGAIILVHHFLL